MLIFARKWIVVLCLAALLFAALTPGASGVVPAILVPLWLSVELVVGGFLAIYAGARDAREFAFLPVLASRPPPAV